MIKLRREEKRNILLYNTIVDNLFINDMLPLAPGEYVKIYIFGLMYAEQNEEISPAKMASILGVREDVIDKAWVYWEKQGVVKRSFRTPSGEDEDYDVIFLNTIEKLCRFGAVCGGAAEMHGDADAGRTDFAMAGSDAYTDREKDDAAALRSIYDALEEAGGRTLSGSDMEMAADALGTYGITPEIYSYAIKYCADREKYNVKYITKVALHWKEEGCTTEAEARSYLEKGAERQDQYRRIFREMGFNRGVSDPDRELMAKWFDEYGFSIKEILQACRLTAGMREPSLRYVNKVLENKYRDRGGDPNAGAGGKRTVSKRVLSEYLDFIRGKEASDLKKRREEVLANIPIMNEVLRREKELSRAIINFDFTDRGKKDRKRSRAEMRKLGERKKEILRQNGYAEDYTEVRYMCPICKDTGVKDDGRICECVADRTEEAYTWNQKRTATKAK